MKQILTMDTWKSRFAIAPIRLAVMLFAVLFVVGCSRDAPEPAEVDPAALRLIATANEALEQDAFDRAMQLADSAHSLAPSAAEPLFLKGLIYSRTLRWKDAEEAYRSAIERDPDLPGVWNNLGNNAVWQGDYNKALAYYRNEINVEPAARPWAGMGRIYREQGIIDSAAYAFEQAIALDSTYIPAYLSYAMLMEDEGEYERALIMAEKARKIHPDGADVKYIMGSLLDRLGRDEEAISYLEDVTTARPWHTESHYKLGRLLQRVGREEDSRSMLAEAEELWKKQADITAYQKAVATNPDDPYAQAALATAFRMAGRYEEAVHTYKVALSLDPDNLEFRNNLASLHFLQKDTLAAIRTYKEIVGQDPDMVDVWVNLGVLYALRGDSQNARQVWQNALARRPDDPKIRAYLARLDSGR